MLIQGLINSPMWHQASWTLPKPADFFQHTRVHHSLSDLRKCFIISVCIIISIIQSILTTRTRHGSLEIGCRHYSVLVKLPDPPSPEIIAISLASLWGRFSYVNQTSHCMHMQGVSAMPFTEYARTFKYTYQASQVHTGKKKELGRPRMRLKSPMSSGHKYVARVVFGCLETVGGILLWFS